MSSILGIDEFNALYGPFRTRGANLKLNPANVPEVLWPLIPYAEFWALAGDPDRSHLVELASPEVRQNLYDTFAEYYNQLNTWLGGTEAEKRPYSSEYIAFTEMTMAAELVPYIK
jgi:hypothetical protein